MEYLDNKDSIKLNELIHWVKQELLSEEARSNDPVPLFAIDEVTVEVNFILAGKGSGGFDLKVVKADAEVAEERVQKAVVRMKPLLSHAELVAKLLEKHPEIEEEIVSDSVKVMLKGRTLDKESVPPRE